MRCSVHRNMSQCVAVCAVCAAVCGGVLVCAGVCCGVLLCAIVCYSVLCWMCCGAAGARASSCQRLGNRNESTAIEFAKGGGVVFRIRLDPRPSCLQQPQQPQQPQLHRIRAHALPPRQNSCNSRGCVCNRLQQRPSLQQRLRPLPRPFPQPASESVLPQRPALRDTPGPALSAAHPARL